MIFLKALFAGLLDRFRGNGGIFTVKGIVYDTPRFITLLLVGYAFSIIFGVYWGWDAFQIAFWIGVGLSFGYGQPLGAALKGITPTEWKLRRRGDKWEWWQFGILKTNSLAALSFRGFMVGLPLLVFNPLYAVIISLAYSISFPLAIKIVFNMNDAWAKQEVIRSFLSGLIAGGIVWLCS